MTQSLDAAMSAWAGSSPALPVGVAYSGGADSTALLAACHAQWGQGVVALHVNHGLQAAAGQFEAHCRAFCAFRGIALRVSLTDARAAPGDSPEDAARRARYRALADLAVQTDGPGSVKTVALAQHADDQIETLLLALSRGAGVAGLAGMAAHWQRDGLAFARPLLQVRGDLLRSWLAEHHLEFVDDPTNADQRFTRNRIRHRVLPALLDAFPHLHDTLARSSVHAAQASRLLDVLAQQDLDLAAVEDGAALSIAKLRLMSHDRQANALRYWLKSRHSTIPAAAQLAELQDQIAACTTRGHRIQIRVAAGVAERKGAALHWYNPAVSLDKK